MKVEYDRPDGCTCLDLIGPNGVPKRIEGDDCGHHELDPKKPTATEVLEDIGTLYFGKVLGMLVLLLFLFVGCGQRPPVAIPEGRSTPMCFLMLIGDEVGEFCSESMGICKRFKRVAEIAGHNMKPKIHRVGACKRKR